MQLVDTFFLPDCREEGMPRRELLSDGNGEINTPTGALLEHIEGCVLSFQAHIKPCLWDMFRKVLRWL